MLAQCSTLTGNGRGDPYIELLFVSLDGKLIERRLFEWGSQVTPDIHHCKRWSVKEPSIQPLIRGLFDSTYSRMAALLRTEGSPVLGTVEPGKRYSPLEPEKSPSFGGDPDRSHPVFDPGDDDALLYVEGKVETDTEASIKRFRISAPDAGAETAGSVRLVVEPDDNDSFTSTSTWLEGTVAPFDVARRQVRLPPLPASARSVWSPLASPDGSRYAFLGGSASQPEVWLIEGAAAAPRFLYKGGGGRTTESYLLEWRHATAMQGDR